MLILISFVIFFFFFLLDAMYQGMAITLKQNRWSGQDIQKLRAEVQTVTSNSGWYDSRHLYGKYSKKNIPIWREIARRCFPARSWNEVRRKYKTIDYLKVNTRVLAGRAPLYSPCSHLGVIIETIVPTHWQSHPLYRIRFDKSLSYEDTLRREEVVPGTRFGNTLVYAAEVQQQNGVDNVSEFVGLDHASDDNTTTVRSKESQQVLDSPVKSNKEESALDLLDKNGEGLAAVITFDQVFAYVTKIEQQFKNGQEKKYHMFLNILNEYTQKQTPVKDVLNRVCCQVAVCVCIFVYVRVCLYLCMWMHILTICASFRVCLH